LIESGIDGATDLDFSPSASRKVNWKCFSSIQGNPNKFLKFSIDKDRNFRVFHRLSKLQVCCVRVDSWAKHLRSSIAKFPELSVDGQIFSEIRANPDFGENNCRAALSQILTWPWAVRFVQIDIYFGREIRMRSHLYGFRNSSGFSLALTHWFSSHTSRCCCSWSTSPFLSAWGQSLSDRTRNTKRWVSYESACFFGMTVPEFWPFPFRIRRSDWELNHDFDLSEAWAAFWISVKFTPMHGCPSKSGMNRR
jgi:hypothetical protein